jgi:hypothetical protein
MNQDYTPIRATVDSSILSRVNRIFDASHLSVFTEIIQNARRAGATEMSVRIERRLDDSDQKSLTITAADNGSGMEDPADLLCLAKSGWGQDTVDDEDPAGMGFFCLSNCPDVTVASRGWEVDLTPAVFSGEEECLPRAARATISGLSVRWSWPVEDAFGLHGVRSSLENAARYCGLERVICTVLDAEPDGDVIRELIITPEGYMADCDFVEEHEALGISIGVVDGPGTDAFYTFGRPQCKYNFYGVVVEDHHAHHALSVAAEDYYDLRKYVRELRVDVRRCVGLHMVLPARNAIKTNEASMAVSSLALTAAFRHIAHSWYGAHTLPYAAYMEAQELGVDIGEALYKLYHPGGGSAIYRTDGGDRPLLLPGHLRHASLESVWGDHRTGYVLVRPDRDMEGYSWYDELPRVKDVKVRIDGERYEPDGDAMHDKVVDMGSTSGFFVEVDDLAFVLTLDDGEEIELEVDRVAHGGEDFYEFGDLVRSDYRMLVRRRAMSTSKKAEIIDHVVDVFFDAGMSSECPESEFYRDCEAYVANLSAGPIAALMVHLEDAFAALPYECLDSDYQWTLRYRGGKGRDGLSIVGVRKHDTPRRVVLMGGKAWEVYGDDDEVMAQLENSGLAGDGIINPSEFLLCELDCLDTERRVL